MKPIDFQTLIENINIYEEEICRIFGKLLEEDLKAKTNILSYDTSTHFERVEWEMSDGTNISVRYYDDHYGVIKILARILFNDEEIDKWIQGLISDKLICAMSMLKCVVYIYATTNGTIIASTRTMAITAAAILIVFLFLNIIIPFCPVRTHEVMYMQSLFVTASIKNLGPVILLCFLIVCFEVVYHKKRSDRRNADAMPFRAYFFQNFRHQSMRYTVGATGTIM